MLAAGPVFADFGRAAWQAVDRIVRGAKPADIPIQQPTRYSIVISQKIAKAMGMTIPQAMLAQAAEVID